MKASKLSSLAARLETRRLIAEARHAVHAQASVAVSLLERAHEVRALDVEVLDLETIIARISDKQKPEHHRIRFGPFKFDLVISDKEQLRKLVAVLKTWREALLGADGEARIELAERLAAELTGSRPAKRAPESASPDPELPLLNGHAPVSRWGA